MGGFPAERVPLRPQTLEVREFPKYRREKFVFTSRPGVSVLGYLLTPAGARPPLPVVICVPGHGRGVDDIVGIDDEGRDRTDKAGYAHDFAIQAVEHGLAAVAIEPLGFGCRRDPNAKKKGLGTSSCQPAAGAALLFGETMIAWRVYDVMRTVDWIQTRRELDAARVGSMGISGGGTCTLFAAALDSRIRAAMVSGYLNTFRDSILSLSHCMDNYVPGILNWAVLGCLEWQTEGLGEPEAVRKATAEYRSESDIPGAFVDDCCVVGPEYEAPASGLYKDYRRWAEETGERILPQNVFGAALTERGFASDRFTSGIDKGKKRWTGIGRKSPLPTGEE